MTDVADPENRTRRSRRALSSDAAAFAEDRRLGMLHLRLGGLALARAELEDLHRRGALDTATLAGLAEARWRSGDLEAAAAAAASHLAGGGMAPIALVIAAEGAAATGRPGEARAHVDALGTMSATELEHLFAGMPRRAHWPSAPSAPIGPPDTLFGVDGAGRPGAGSATATNRVAAGPISSDGVVSPDGHPVMAGLWGDDESALVDRAASRAPRPPAEPEDELAIAREELGSGNAGEVARGLTRLALVLRLDPTFAPVILDAVGPRREVDALLLRGDACRLLGRHLEAEAAFAAAGRLLDGPGSGQPA